MKKAAILLISLLAACLRADPALKIVAPAVSQKQSPAAILATMKKVADWQLARPLVHPADDWTYGACYAGLTALSAIADDPKYHNALLEMGSRQQWKPGLRTYHADDHCVAQTYLDLYLQHRDPAMLEPIRQEFDLILAHSKTNSLRFVTDASAERWTWCDALFMGPPTWVRLYNATGDNRYLQYMDQEWRATWESLYDRTEHLFFRDSRYFTQRESNGKKIFWSRGNGWVLAGLARVLQNMPPDFSGRNFYEQQFKDMAAKIASLQQDDGLWRSSLLDPESYPSRETSGSGFHTFALAWGVNRGLLDAASYEPVIRKAWKGLVNCVTPDGKLEHVQPIGADPKKFDPTHSDVFGVGAFLLAGSEVYRLTLARAPAPAYCAFMPQRMDDFAWENDRIAFRAYGPALERTGEISSGIDVWVKRTRRPVIEKWYYNANYHEDLGEGLDMYKVGPSRGCGGSGIWRSNNLYVAKNFLTWHIVQCGPSRITFELTYAPYDAGGVTVRERKRISLDSGSNLNRIETLMDWNWSGPERLTLAVGIVKQPGSESVDFANDDSWMSCWEPAQAENGAIGCGVVMSSPSRRRDTADQAFLQTSIGRGQPLVYYAGAGWTRSGDFPNRESWVRYVSRSAEKIK